MKYNFKLIEEKWKKKCPNGPFEQRKNAKKKYYCLDMFPYPSGSGLHVGHWRGYILSDIYARKQWLNNCEILHPMGWDAFGLPAENFAITNKIHPEVATKQNIAIIKNQIMDMWAIYDWQKEINTTDPNYYKWTQWIFIKMFQAGLAYEAMIDINWCPSCKTGLANEEAIDNKCDRCGTQTEKKKIRQWMLKITTYAQELLDGLNKLDWPEKVKSMQRNWIGKSSGCEIPFALSHDNTKSIIIFTTLPETICGATFIGITKEHPILKELFTQFEYEKLQAECQEAAVESLVWGVFTQYYAVNPLTKAIIPIYIASFVLGDYGQGAVMGVPAHDSRDFAFAKKYNISIIKVVEDVQLDHELPLTDYENGILINSGQFNNLRAQTAGRKQIIEYLVKHCHAKEKTMYKMRDWVFSRQRYWGEPIPIIHCKHCGPVAVPEDQLPVTLPYVSSYLPSGTGESPLVTMTDWKNTTCPNCKQKAERETNTMPQWAGSSWYFLRYPSPDDTKAFADKKLVNYWCPVDLYVGGVEHAILHLLYARFYTKFLYSINAVSFDEPFIHLFNQGMITKYSEKTNGLEKMSKSKQNVVSPDELIHEFGTDALRLYILFLGPPENDCQWQDNGIEGCSRFLNKLWMIMTDKAFEGNMVSSKENFIVHTFLKNFNQRINNFSPNTAVAAAMEMTNDIIKNSVTLTKDSKIKILTALSTMAPFVCSELLDILFGLSLQDVSWPEEDESFLKTNTYSMSVQLNGKLKGVVEFDNNATEETIKQKSKEIIQNHVNPHDEMKIIFVPKRTVNFVVKKKEL